MCSTKFDAYKARGKCTAGEISKTGGEKWSVNWQNTHVCNDTSGIWEITNYRTPKQRRTRCFQSKMTEWAMCVRCVTQFLRQDRLEIFLNCAYGKRTAYGMVAFWTVSILCVFACYSYNNQLQRRFSILDAKNEHTRSRVQNNQNFIEWKSNASHWIYTREKYWIRFHFDA